MNEKHQLEMHLNIHVRDHDQAVKFFQEMGLEVKQHNREDNFVASHMKLNEDSDVTITILEHPEFDQAGMIEMTIDESDIFRSRLRRSFVLTEANFYPRLKIYESC